MKVESFLRVVSSKSSRQKPDCREFKRESENRILNQGGFYEQRYRKYGRAYCAQENFHADLLVFVFKSIVKLPFGPDICSPPPPLYSLQMEQLISLPLAHLNSPSRTMTWGEVLVVALSQLLSSLFVPARGFRLEWLALLLTCGGVVPAALLPESLLGFWIWILV